MNSVFDHSFQLFIINTIFQKKNLLFSLFLLTKKGHIKEIEKERKILLLKKMGKIMFMVPC